MLAQGQPTGRGVSGAENPRPDGVMTFSPQGVDQVHTSPCSVGQGSRRLGRGVGACVGVNSEIFHFISFDKCNIILFPVVII